MPKTLPLTELRIIAPVYRRYHRIAYDCYSIQGVRVFNKLFNKNIRTIVCSLVVK